MDKNHLIQLTQDLYRLTLLFPKKEPLRYKMREMADEILNKCLRSNLEQSLVLLEDLEVLDSFFEVAKIQNWAALVDLLRIQEEYNRIKAEIKKISKQPAAEGQILVLTKFPERRSLEVKVRRPIGVEFQSPGVGKLLEVSSQQIINSRQEKILAILKEKGKIQVWQVKQFFPEVTKRTLRRDFESLFKRGIIERVGEKNATFYQLPRLVSTQ